MKKMAGFATSPEVLVEKCTDLGVIATVHNFAEIVSVLVLLLVIIAESFGHAMGLTAGGGLESAMAVDFRESSISGGWRRPGDVGLSETLQVLVFVLVARVVATLAEEKYGSVRFGPRRAQVKKLIELLLRDGPRPFRVICWCFVLGQLFILPEEMAFYGQYVYRLADYYEAQNEADSAAASS